MAGARIMSLAYGSNLHAFSLTSRIRGEDIAAAQCSLPTCEPSLPDTTTADVDAQHVGRVRICFTKMHSKHHRTRRWFWVAASAELL
jgi:hypothetical protein